MFYRDFRIDRSKLTFCLIIIQSIGPRLIEGQGIFLSIIILLLSYNGFRLLNIKDIIILISSTLFLALNKFLNSSFSFTNLVYQLSLIYSLYIFLAQYKNRIKKLQDDFYFTLKLFIFHAFIGYIIYLIFPSHFKPINNTINSSFYYLFYVSAGDFMSIKRNTGFFWEPGVYQIAANYFLFYSIKFNKKTNYLIVGFLSVISSLSTTGLLVLSINVVYFIFSKIKSKKNLSLNLIILATLITLFIPILTLNTREKINDQNTSGLIRLRDIYVGIELIKEKPILGHGVFDKEYLISKGYVFRIENDLFSQGFLESTGEMGGGYTNGLLGLAAWYGLPTALIIYFFYFKNKFIGKSKIERLLFCSIMLISMISEPIAYTSLFLMFPFSYWILNKKLDCIHGKQTNNDYNCNI